MSLHISGDRSTSNDEGVPIVFDLETTGLELTAEIVQIGAKYRQTEFNVYIMPTHDIPTDATAITGLSVVNNRLMLRDKNGIKPVETTPARTAYIQFIVYLNNISNNVILVAHYGTYFDAPRIMRAMDKHNLLNEFKSVVKGFVDTIPVFKNVPAMKKRVKERKNFKLISLACDYLEPKDTRDAHNAISDVRMLHALLLKFSVTKTTLNSFVVSIENISYNKDDNRHNKKQVSDTLAGIKGTVASSTICKIASANISLKKLIETFVARGENGISELFGEIVGGRARVTGNQDIQKKVCTAIQNYINRNNNV